jgi:hypothetical protein
MLEKKLAEQKVNTSLWRDKCHEILDAVEIANHQNHNLSPYQSLKIRDYNNNNNTQRELGVGRPVTSLQQWSPKEGSFESALSLHYSSSEKEMKHPETDEYSDHFISSASLTPMGYHTPHKHHSEPVNSRDNSCFSFQSPVSPPPLESQHDLKFTGRSRSGSFRERPTSRSLFKESQPAPIYHSSNEPSPTISHPSKKIPFNRQISPRKTVPIPVPHTFETLETTPIPKLLKGTDSRRAWNEKTSSPSPGGRRWNPYFGHSNNLSSPKSPSPSAYDLVMNSKHQPEPQPRPKPLKPISPIFHHSSRRTSAPISPDRISIDSREPVLPTMPPQYVDDSEQEIRSKSPTGKTPCRQSFGSSAADGEETFFSWNLTE